MNPPASRREKSSIGGGGASANAVWRAQERGGRLPDPGARARFGLIFPNAYRIGMSNLGLHFLHRALNRIPDAAAERFFLDAAQCSVDADTPLTRFPVLLFSLSFELDYVNVVRLLRANRIPPAARARRPEHPLVIGGGVAVGLNRLPVYDFFDAFLIGDGERLAEPLARCALEADGDPAELLRRLAELPGAEVTRGARERFGLEPAAADEAGEGCDENGAPYRPAAVTPAWLEDAPSEVCASAILTPETEFGDRALIEISRGCPYRCAFCYMGNSRRRCQPRPLELIQEALERWRPYTRRFGFVASAVGSHPRIDALCRHCDDVGAAISFSSLRVEDVTPTMLDSLARSGQRTLTIAPEAGSARLRTLLDKRLTDEQIYQFAEDALRRGLRNLKLYFMLGLPGEEPEDVDAIAELTRRLREIMLGVQRPSGRLGSIAVGAGIFVPKPGTPLLRMPLPEPAQTRAHLKQLRKQLGRLANVELQTESLRQARLQTILSLGDRRAGALLLELAESESPPSRLARRTQRSLNEQYGLGLAE